MNTLPTKWYIEVTEENKAELNRWRKKVATEYRDHTVRVGHTLLSRHQDDGSYYHTANARIVRGMEEYNDYQEITLEQFRQITNSNPNPMSKHPENWYITLTADNYADIKPWWLEQVEKSGWKSRHLHDHNLVLSNHPKDNSHYWSGPECQFNTMHPSYEKITLEQFRQITNPMNTLPTKWYIQATEKNREELNAWRLKNATQYLLRYHFAVGHTLLSEHQSDKSCYYSDDADAVRNCVEYKDYQEITLEQFRQITNPKPMLKTEVKTIQISRTLLNEYYDAATKEQKEYIVNHFKMDGTTTDEAIRGLYDLACWDWKPKIKANHPDCFPKDSKYFDFSKHTNQYGCDSIVSNNVAESLGLCRNFIQVRGSSTENNDRSFYLDRRYNWELVNEEDVTVLIPTKKIK